MNNGLTAAERTARQTAQHAGFYFARSGAVRYMICKRTRIKYITAFSFAEMNKKVLAMFR